MAKENKTVKRRYKVNGKDLFLGMKMYDGYVSGSFLAKEGDTRLGYLRFDWRYESDGKHAVFFLPKVTDKDQSLIRDESHLAQWREFARKRFIEILGEDGIMISTAGRKISVVRRKPAAIEEEVAQYALSVME